MRRLNLSIPDQLARFLDRELALTGRFAPDLIRQYITDRPEFKAFAKNSTTRSETGPELAEQLAEAIVRPYIHNLEIDDERRPQLGETVLTYRARLAKSGLVEPRFDTDPPWVDGEV
jgi:hypothetical protein